MKTEEELRDAAFLALHDALGPGDGLRFMRFYRPEPGDFTQEKYLYLGNPSLEEVLASIDRARAGNPGRTNDEVRRRGFQALKDALGTRESMRFLRLYTGADAAWEREFVECGEEVAGRGR